MTESDFNELSDAVFARIEQAIDASGADIECNLNGAVMEIEFVDGSQVIVNRHAPNQEMWLAAKSGGFHYHFDNEHWLSRRDKSEFFSQLAQLIQLGAGIKIDF
jgi:CyaY protein